MKSKSKLKFGVGDLVKFVEDAEFGEEEDYGVVTKIVKRRGGNNKTFNHYGIFWMMDNGQTLESYKWADKSLELMARGKNKC